VLTDNVRMVRVFVDAGYQATRSYGEDAIHLVFYRAQAIVEVWEELTVEIKDRSYVKVWTLTTDG
jgi:hypothetical protein